VHGLVSPLSLTILPYNVNNFLSLLLGENYFKNKWENSDGWMEIHELT
jgi:hypothetical protein